MGKVVKAVVAVDDGAAAVVVVVVAADLVAETKMLLNIYLLRRIQAAEVVE
jgi:hypothetical protein